MDDARDEAAPQRTAALRDGVEFPGRTIIIADAAVTALFVASAVVAAAVFSQPWKSVAVAVDLAAFAAGVGAFLWSWWTAVQRSRHDDIGVSSLYFLADGCAPRRVSAIMNSLLAVQVTAAIVTASVRSSTDGRPGSTLAFGILVPVLGLGLNGLWGAVHGTFPPRAARESRRVPRDGARNGQD